MIPEPDTYFPYKALKGLAQGSGISKEITRTPTQF
jgi:hypothetical protein